MNWPPDRRHLFEDDGGTTLDQRLPIDGDGNGNGNVLERSSELAIRLLERGAVAFEDLHRLDLAERRMLSNQCTDLARTGVSNRAFDTRKVGQHGLSLVYRGAHAPAGSSGS
jgi:hypothetical protein